MNTERENEVLYQQPDYLADHKLTKEGKTEIKKRWEAAFAGRTYEEINSELPELLANLTDSELDKKIKKSFKIRAKAVQRREFLEELKNTDNKWHEEYLMLKTEYPNKRDTDIAAFILNNKIEPEPKPETKKKESSFPVQRLLGMAFLALGVWGGWQLYSEDNQMKMVEESDKQRYVMSTPLPTETTVIYQATETNQASATPNIAPTKMAVPTSTMEIIPTQTEATPKVEPKNFMVGNIDMSQPVIIKIDGTAVDFANVPLINKDPEKWDDSLVTEFNSIKDPSATLITETDRPGLLAINGHSFSLHGKELPFDPLIKLTADELKGKKVTLEQNGVTQELAITFTNTIDASQFFNSNAPGENGDPMYLRSNFSQNDKGDKIGLGIPDNIRAEQGIVMIACTGEKSRDPIEKYKQRRVIVASIVDTHEQPITFNNYVSEAAYLTGKINEYGTTHTPQSQEKLGTYLKETPWYEGKTDQQRQNLTSVLSVLDNKTYIYSDIKGPQVAQCIDFVSLMSALDYPESPKNVGAIAGVHSARDIVETSDHMGFAIKGNVWDIGLQSLSPGDLIMFGPHFVVVLENDQTKGAVFADVNRDMDGTGIIYYAQNDMELRGLFPPGSVAGRQKS